MISKIIFMLIVIFTGNVFAGEGGIRNPTWEAIRGVKPPKIPTSPPDENGLYSGMGFLDYLARSIYKPSDIDKAAPNYFTHIGVKNPIDKYINPAKEENRQEAIRAIATDQFSVNPARPSLQRMGDVRKYAESVLAKGGEPTKDYMKVEIGVPPPFDNYYQNWASWLIAVAQSGSRGQKEWPSGTDPVVGEIGWGLNLTQSQYEKGIFYSIQPDDKNYSMNRDSEFSPDLSSGKARAQILMRQTLFLLMAIPRVLGERVDFKFAGNGLKFIAKGDPETYSTRYINYDVNESEKYSYGRSLIESLEPNAEILADLKRLEEAIYLWHFMALSEKNEPIKFAFKAPNRLWVIVTFTENGIVANPVTEGDEYKVLPQLAPWHKRSKSDVTCFGYGAWANPCQDYFLSRFGEKKILNAVAWVRFVKDAEAAKADPYKQ
jgi:hypothetical protein